MAIIKVTSSGLVITKSGLPTCTCCDGSGPCDPDVLMLYVEYQNDDASFSYYELTGSLNAGSFTGTGTYGPLSLTWDAGEEEWILDDSNHAYIIPSETPQDRCDAEQVYFFPATNTAAMTSFSPLP